MSHSKLRIETDKGILWEIREHFSFFVPGYKFMPKYRQGFWDGKIRIFDYNTQSIPAGLWWKLKKFCKSRNYPISVKRHPEFGSPEDKGKVDPQEIWNFVKDLKVSSKGKDITIRDYQFNAVCEALTEKRCLLISPTASGKSLIIYCILRWIQASLEENERILVIVPTTALVEQMYSDFADYAAKDDSWDAGENCHRIYSGKEKVNILQGVFISTWQSIYKLPKTWFRQFKLIFGDEAHGFTANSMEKAMEKAELAEYRIGTTGTLSGSKTHEMVLEGIFGKIIRVTTTAELQRKKEIADLHIKRMILEYNPEDRAVACGLKYHDEIKWLITNDDRNKLIRNLACSLEGNTIVMFRFIEHGKELYEMIKDKSKDRVFYVAGATHTDDREAIRRIVETQKNAKIVASDGVFSTGTNIKNLHNMIFTTPSKAQIRVLQSIGRTLRQSDNGVDSTLYDMIDDLRKSSKTNYAWKHGEVRRNIYDEEQFKYETHKVKMK